MPVVTAITSQVPQSSLNAYRMVRYMMSRCPGYDPSEYLRECNSAYVHVWEEISKIRVNYFTETKVVTVAKGQTTFDLLYNEDAALDQALSSRLYQLIRIRVLPPSGGLYQASRSVYLTKPDFMAISANPSSTPTFTGPYYYCPVGKGSVQWGLPLALQTQMEIFYSYWLVNLGYLADETVTVTAGTTSVVGTNTSFTQICPPDFQDCLPGSGFQEIIAELELNGHTYRVKSITDDTHLTLFTPVATRDANGGVAQNYVLASSPEIPREHHRVIASLALANFYTAVVDDDRAEFWMSVASRNIQMMKDSLIERQGQNPPSKVRFPYGIARRNRVFLR